MKKTLWAALAVAAFTGHALADDIDTVRAFYSDILTAFFDIPRLPQNPKFFVSDDPEAI